MDPNARLAGCLVGQAIGDMVGLPYENLSRRRVDRLASFERPRFFFGYGCGSDDTEHAGLTAEALAFAGDDWRRGCGGGSSPGRRHRGARRQPGRGGWGAGGVA